MTREWNVIGMTMEGENGWDWREGVDSTASTGWLSTYACSSRARIIEVVYRIMVYSIMIKIMVITSSRFILEIFIFDFQVIFIVQILVGLSTIGWNEKIRIA